jgi:chorismate synthase
MISPSTSYRAYQSSSNYNKDNSEATMYFTIKGYDTFTFYIRSNGESDHDYVMVGKDSRPTTSSNYTTSYVSTKTGSYVPADTSTYKYEQIDADYVYDCKYGIRDHRGGGRSSARETAVRVCAGALAKLVLKQLGINVVAYTSRVGEISLPAAYTAYDLSQAENNDVRCPDAEAAAAMESLIMEVKRAGDTVGGVVTCVIKGAPAGLGEPLYDKLSASLASAMLSINAAKGFDYGNGFAASTGRGSQQNDVFYNDEGKIATRTNNSGGIQGGISNGNDIYFRVAFKPVATLLMEQQTVTKDGTETTLLSRGRHDPCVVPRAVPVVEAMAALVLLDHYLLDRAGRNLFS